MKLLPLQASVLRRRRAGFTLIEVLVALAIFMMIGIVLGSAYINVINAYELTAQSARRDEDIRFARDALLAESEREKVEEGAEFDAGNGRRVRWRGVIEPTATTDVFQVTFSCEINSPELKKPETREETFRLLRPTWSEPAERDKLRADAKQRILEIQNERANSR